MPTKLIRDSITFKPGSGGPMQESRTYTLPGNILSVSAVMTGFDTEFTYDDHHLGHVKVKLDAVASAKKVVLTAHLELRDYSGAWDDTYDGMIEFLIVAEVEPTPLVNQPARGAQPALPKAHL